MPKKNRSYFGPGVLTSAATMQFHGFQIRLPGSKKDQEQDKHNEQANEGGALDDDYDDDGGGSGSIDRSWGGNEKENGYVHEDREERNDQIRVLKYKQRQKLVSQWNAEKWSVLGTSSDEEEEEMDKEMEEESNGVENEPLELPEWEDDTSHAESLGGKAVANEPQPSWESLRENEGKIFENGLKSLVDDNVQGYHIIKDWSWNCDNVPQSSPLQKILEKDKHKTLGCCMGVPPDLPPGQRPAMLDNRVLSMVRLIDYCEMNPVNSRSFLDGLLKIIKEEIKIRNFDVCNHLSRDVVLKKILDKYGLDGGPDTFRIPVSLEIGNPRLVDEPQQAPQLGSTQKKYAVDCIAFNVKRNLLDLLDDGDIFGNLNNLVVNNDPEKKRSPFDPYRNVSGVSDEILDGTWYRDTLARLREYDEDPFVDGVDFLLPIILYCDKTGTSMNQRYPLEPLLFTTAIIKRKLRNYPRSWRPAGYIPDIENKSSAESRYIREKNKGATAQSYHLALSYLLKGFRQLQNDGIVTWLQFGRFRKKVRLRVEIAFIIGDGKSADMMTCRYPSTWPTRRISRSCTCLARDSDQVSKQCEYIVCHPKGRLRGLFQTIGSTISQIQENHFNNPSHNSDTESVDTVWSHLVDTDGNPVDGNNQIQKGKGKNTNNRSGKRKRGTGEHVGGKNRRRLTDTEARHVIEKAKETLNKKSFNPANNAFVDANIRFGLDPRSVWGANPVDLMHAFQSGIVMYIMKMTLDNVGNTNQMLLDRLVDRLFHGLRCKEKREGYPRINFAKGFSKLTMLTSDEWVGKLFVLLLALSTKDGKHAIGNAFDETSDLNLPKCLGPLAMDQAREFEEQANEVDKKREHLKDEEHATAEGEQRAQKAKRKEDEPEEMLRKCSVSDFVHLAEALLCFHAFYKKGNFELQEDGTVDRKSIHGSIARMLAMIRLYTPRKKGNGWKLQKLHELLHLALDIERFGPPSNFDAGPNESGLRYWAKLVSMTAQKRGYNIFAHQVADRVHEMLCFAKALRIHGIVGVREKGFYKVVHPEQKGSRKQNQVGSRVCTKGVGNSLMGTGYRIFQEISNGPDKVLGNQKKRKGSFVVSPVIKTFLRRHWLTEKDKNGSQVPLHTGTIVPPYSTDGSNCHHWDLKTECSMVPATDPQRITLRCSPNFNNEGAWFDWVIVHFECDLNSFCEIGHQTQFARGCVPCKILAFHQDDGGNIMALVHGCSFKKNEEQFANDSVLLECWNLEYITINVTTKVRDTLVVSEDGREALVEGCIKRPNKVPHLAWIALDSILCRCLVVEETPGIHETVSNNRSVEMEQTRVWLVRSHDRWAAEFN